MSEGIIKLPWTFNVKPLAKALETTVFWNSIDLRTKDPQSVHREVDDIWLRHGALDDPDTRADKPGYSFIWYHMPGLVSIVKPMAHELMGLVGGTSIGTVLITRLPPGKMVHDHIDASWNARTHAKYAISIAANHDQFFRVGETDLRSVTGQSFWFDNSILHSVQNNSNEPRITLIISILTPRGIHVS